MNHARSDINRYGNRHTANHILSFSVKVPDSASRGRESSHGSPLPQQRVHNVIIVYVSLEKYYGGRDRQTLFLDHPDRRTNHPRGEESRSFDAVALINVR